ncbi:YccT family protein [Vibrio vulnificus]|uniref:YccT family protein n=1 Tax=Vibrio vulnificus TaxID=672 RepID=UPI000A4B9CE6|nr:DUF2057 family protein [Vibrio vulnificus]
MMKNFCVLMMPLALLAANSVRADVVVHVHRDVAPLVVNGDGVGYSLTKKNKIVLQDGKNQLAVRVEKLIPNNLGEFEKFNSQVSIVTFDSYNIELTVEPGYTLTKKEQADKFNTNPTFVLKDNSGNIVPSIQELLPNGGGFTRDYETEVSKYNKKNSIVLTSSEIPSSEVEKAEPTKAEATSTEEKGVEMVQYWYEKASNEDKKQFASLAFENRKSEIAKQNTKSQELDMLVYWFNQTSENGRKNIINWIMNN